MNNLQTHIDEYLEFCKTTKRLNEKTIKAYKIDLTQLTVFLSSKNVTVITTITIENYIAHLHQEYKPKTVKRKIASTKALFHYLDYKEIIEQNPYTC